MVPLFWAVLCLAARGVPGDMDSVDALKTGINGPSAIAYDAHPHGTLYIVEQVCHRLLRLDLSNSSIQVVLSNSKTVDDDSGFPHAVAVDHYGNVFVADFNGRLRELISGSAEPITLLPQETFNVPASLAVDNDGNLLIVDRNHKLFRWRIDLAKLETIAGTGSPGYAGDGGTANNARLRFPDGVAVNSTGDIFVADYGNCRIRRIDHRTQIITTYAGTGECDSKGDGGPATRAALNYPSSLAIDASGSLYFVEGATDRVRRITSNGIISTYVGTGSRGFSGDGGPAKKATLNNPSGVALDDSGNVYIAEFVNNRIRRVDVATHKISTVAGDGTPAREDLLL